MPSIVNNPDHEVLQTQVVQGLEKRGFLVTSMTYHDKLPKPFVERLQNCDTFTSLSVRGEADRIAVHREKDLCLTVEIKTVRDRKPDQALNLVVEALPLLYHLNNDAECLYVFRLLRYDGTVKLDGGFWARRNDVPPIECVFLPKRWSQWRPGFRARVLHRLRLGYPLVPIVDLNGTNGSSDPFVKFSPDVLAATTTEWTRLVDGWMSRELLQIKRLEVLRAPAAADPFNDVA